MLAIIGLTLAKIFGWLWMDPLAGIVGALVIANWSYGLVRDTGAILLDICPTDTIEKRVRNAFETAGDQLLDLHVWRLGPGHFGAVVAVGYPVSGRIRSSSSRSCGTAIQALTKAIAAATESHAPGMARLPVS